jgi:hypothetical protein
MPAERQRARIFRWVEPGTLPGRKLIAIYDATKNLLIIDKEKYALLDWYEQACLLRTQLPYWEFSEPWPR